MVTGTIYLNIFSCHRQIKPRTRQLNDKPKMQFYFSVFASELAARNNFPNNNLANWQ